VIEICGRAQSTLAAPQGKTFAMWRVDFLQLGGRPPDWQCDRVKILVMQTWLSNLWKRWQPATALLLAVLAALYVLNGSSACLDRCGEFGDCRLSLLVAKNC
jgi:hypothetical protein